MVRLNIANETDKILANGKILNMWEYRQMTDKEKIGRLAIMMYELNLQGIDFTEFTKLFPDYADKDIIRVMWLLYCVIDTIREKQEHNDD